ncbi:adenylyl-sulfate kinase [Reinekea sp. G2M2-21]|uniref:adenylyl-sulfate kinase n=1 Tax=Reinekea sp. G2M2-21 TaxID=2788942 RepID=UPI0018ABF115|nr:adenylyl-sulfate kinase [Reinekea sp. G2M2-21]
MLSAVKEIIPLGDFVWNESSVTPAMRSLLMQQTPRCIWLTGLSGSGKSTIANSLDVHFHNHGLRSFILDGDNIRHGLNRDLGMSVSDRSENIRRVGEVARLLVDAGLIVICAFISPHERDRKLVRSLFSEGAFTEVYLETTLSVCEKRDPKGFYRKARQGLIKEFTGISAPYEEPENPEIVLDTSEVDIKNSVDLICNFINNLKS